MATHAPKSGHPLGLDRESAPGGHLPFAGARASGEGCAESRASARRRHHPPGASYLQNRHRWLRAATPYRHQAVVSRAKLLFSAGNRKRRENAGERVRLSHALRPTACSPARQTGQNVECSVANRDEPGIPDNSGCASGPVYRLDRLDRRCLGGIIRYAPCRLAV
jgi:hypothetical protein